MKFIIHTDGGARGNPGPAAVGVVIESDDGKANGKTQLMAEFGKVIGETTNNTAEYTAVLEALEHLRKSDAMRRLEKTDEVNFFLDSTLVVNQLNGLYKVKEPHLRTLLFRVRALETDFGCPIRYAYVPREQNQRADYFVNLALDS